MLIIYIKVALRNLLANRTFTIINTLGLALGMAAALLIYVWVQNELTFDNYHSDVDRIYRVNSHIDVGESVWDWTTVPYLLMPEAKKTVPEIENFSQIYLPYEGISIKQLDRPLYKEEHFAFVDKEWFNLMHYDVIEGSKAAFFDNKYNVAVTSKWAEQHYGTQNVIGQTLIIDSVECVINLVLENNPTNSSFQYDILGAMNIYLNRASNVENAERWGNYNYCAFAKLKKNAATTDIPEKLEAILAQNVEKNNTAFSLEALKDLRFSPIESGNFKTQNKATIYIFSLIGLVLLLVAGFNFINLATAQINKRVKEISVKKIVGASFTHIFSQILLETIIVSLCAVLIALGLSQFFLPYLSTLIEMPLVINLYELSIWQGLGAVMLLSILISGIYPAILLANFKPMKLMKGMSFSQQNISLRKVLVVSQFAVAIIALISTLVIYQQLRFIQKKDLGYDRSMVLAINPSLFTGNWEKNFERFALYESSLRNIPELESMALTSNALVKIQSSSNGTFTWEGKDPEFKATVSKLSADEHLQEVFNLKMVAGNWFEKDKSHKDQIIINEAVIRDIGIPEPIIGRQITFQGQEKKIIGVVKDFHFKNLKEKIKPLMISYKGWGASTILARVNEKNIPAALSKTQDAFVKLFPDIPYSYSFMDETFETMHKEESKTTLLFQIFTSLLIFISCLGLFGLATFAVERRTKEIGIRKVLGANVRLIVQLLSKDFIKLVVFALIIAIPISWKIMQTWLANYAYRIEIEWWMFALAGILAIGLAFFTVSFQSIRAALINPVESLRSE